MFHKNDPIPDFEATDLKGNEISNKDLKGKKVLLSFYRYATCPLCHYRFKRIRDNAKRWNKKGVQIIAVFESLPESIQENIIQENKDPIHFVSDRKQKLYKMFKVKQSWSAVFLALLDPAFWWAHLRYIGMLLFGKKDGAISQVPADFLINEDGTFYELHYGKTIGDHIPIEFIDEFAYA